VILKGTIDKIVNYAVAVAEPEEIILFGSMANGTANVYSDIDLLIITDSCISKKEIVSRISNHAHQYALKTDVLVCSRLELEKELRIPDSFIRAVYKSGKIYYKKMTENLVSFYE
jgi:predicted nucleotidyltransferase